MQKHKISLNLSKHVHSFIRIFHLYQQIFILLTWQRRRNKSDYMGWNYFLQQLLKEHHPKIWSVCELWDPVRTRKKILCCFSVTKSCFRIHWEYAKWASNFHVGKFQFIFKANLDFESRNLFRWKTRCKKSLQQNLFKVRFVPFAENNWELFIWVTRRQELQKLFRELRCCSTSHTLVVGVAVSKDWKIQTPAPTINRMDF